MILTRSHGGNQGIHSRGDLGRFRRLHCQPCVQQCLRPDDALRTGAPFARPLVSQGSRPRRGKVGCQSRKTGVPPKVARSMVLEQKRWRGVVWRSRGRRPCRIVACTDATCSVSNRRRRRCWWSGRGEDSDNLADASMKDDYFVQSLCVLFLVHLFRRRIFEVHVAHSQADHRVHNAEADGSEEDCVQTLLVRGDRCGLEGGRQVADRGRRLPNGRDDLSSVPSVYAARTSSAPSPVIRAESSRWRTTWSRAPERATPRTWPSVRDTYDTIA